MSNIMIDCKGLKCPRCDAPITQRAGFRRDQATPTPRWLCANGHKFSQGGILEHNGEDAGEQPLPKPEREQLDPVQEHRLRQDNKALKARLDDLTRRAAQQEDYAAFLTDLERQPSHRPRWLVERRRSQDDLAIATAMLSDTHFDEVVDPAQINGVNAYNREIALMRLERFFRNVVKLSFDHFAGIRMDGLILPLGGDIVSGNIHEELARTNSAEIMDTVLYWSEQIAHGIEQVGRHFDKIHVPCVVGNHGRNTRKWRAKGTVEDNFDYLIYRMVQRRFSGRDGITFDIPLGTEARWQAYQTRYQMTHGNQFRGGNGVGGIAVPIMRGNYKKQQQEAAVGNPYDILMIGHFHQLMDLGGVLINGALKGQDEYASQGLFGFEHPRQLFFLTDPKWGKTLSAPIHVRSDDEMELWRRYGASNQPAWLAGDGA